MRINPYLMLNGRCEEAFRFYAEILGGTPEFMTWGQSPMADRVPAEQHGAIMHATLNTGGATLMGSDGMPGQPCETKGMSASLMLDEPAEAERIFAAFAADAEVRMPMDKTFFARTFGMLTDRFGTPWMIVCL